MAHKEQRDFVQILSHHLPEFFRGVRVLEVGSLDINGSVRDFFDSADYTGIDIAAGNGVDVVCEGQNYDAPDSSFDHVISCEAMEHNPYWVDTFKNMVRVCRPGGLVTMTCATIGRREHGTRRSQPDSSPLTSEAGWDYYRNLEERDFREEVDMGGVFDKHFFATNWESYDLYFVGLKKALGPGSGPSGGRLEVATRRVLEYLRSENSGGVHQCRRLIAATFGDRGFGAIRKALMVVRSKSKG